MPEKMSKNSKGGYTVTGPHGVHAKNSTKENAEKQVRLLNAIDHGFEPNKKGNFSSKTEATDEQQQTILNESEAMANASQPAPQQSMAAGRAARMSKGSKLGGDLGSWHGKRSKL